VFLEHGIHSANAAQVAKHILETYFAKKEGRPLPAIEPKNPSEPPIADPDSPPALPPVAVADARPINTRTAAP
jgi:hypothetical protein